MGAFDLPLAQKVALFVALPVASLLLYYLLKKSNEEEEVVKPRVVTSRQTIIEVKVPRSMTGSIIGHRGERIKEVQDVTGARIQFKDDQNPDEDRICVIRGTEETAQKAEMIIRRMIAEEPPIVEEMITVPQRCVGRIIGRGGETIRQLCRLSKAKIQVPQEERNSGNTRSIHLQGTPTAIATAKSLIKEKVQEDEAFQAKIAISASNRQERGPRRKTEPESHHTSKNGETNGTKEEEKSERKNQDALTPSDEGKEDQVVTPTAEWPSNRQDYLDVYVSAVEDPGHFWVQVISSKSARLDRLMEDMTRYYTSLDGAKMTVRNPQVGDLLAAPFEYDQNWYRVRVSEVKEDAIDLYYVDFGDSCIIKKSEIRNLRGDFLSLPFQAVEACLANVKPKGDEWSEEAIVLFEDMTYTAKWKVIQAKTINYIQVDDVSMPCLDLVDTLGSEDRNIAKVLIEKGFAEFAQEKAGDSTTSQNKNALPQMSDSSRCVDDNNRYLLKHDRTCASGSEYKKLLSGHEDHLQQSSHPKRIEVIGVKTNNNNTDNEEELVTDPKILDLVDFRSDCEDYYKSPFSLFVLKEKKQAKNPPHSFPQYPADVPVDGTHSLHERLCDTNHVSQSDAKYVNFVHDCDFDDVFSEPLSNVLTPTHNLLSEKPLKNVISCQENRHDDHLKEPCYSDCNVTEKKHLSPCVLKDHVKESRAQTYVSNEFVDSVETGILASRPNTLALNTKTWPVGHPQALISRVEGMDNQQLWPLQKDVPSRLPLRYNKIDVADNVNSDMKKCSKQECNLGSEILSHDGGLSKEWNASKNNTNYHEHPKNMMDVWENDPGENCLPAVCTSSTPAGVGLNEPQNEQSIIEHEQHKMGCYCVNIPRRYPPEYPTSSDSFEAEETKRLPLSYLPKFETSPSLGLIPSEVICQQDWCEEVAKEAGFIVNQLQAYTETEKDESNGVFTGPLDEAKSKSGTADHQTSASTIEEENTQKQASEEKCHLIKGGGIEPSAGPSEHSDSKLGKSHRLKKKLDDIPNINNDQENTNTCNATLKELYANEIMVSDQDDEADDIPFIDCVSDENPNEPEVVEIHDTPLKTRHCYPALLCDQKPQTCQLKNIDPLVSKESDQRWPVNCEEYKKSVIPDDDMVCHDTLEFSSDEQDLFTSGVESDDSSCYSDAIEEYMEIPLADAEADIERELMVEAFSINNEGAMSTKPQYAEKKPPSNCISVETGQHDTWNRDVDLNSIMCNRDPDMECMQEIGSKELGQEFNEKGLLCIKSSKKFAVDECSPPKSNTEVLIVSRNMRADNKKYDFGMRETGMSPEETLEESAPAREEGYLNDLPKSDQGEDLDPGSLYAESSLIQSEGPSACYLMAKLEEMVPCTTSKHEDSESLSCEICGTLVSLEGKGLDEPVVESLENSSSFAGAKQLTSPKGESTDLSGIETAPQNEPLGLIEIDNVMEERNKAPKEVIHKTLDVHVQNSDCFGLKNLAGNLSLDTNFKLTNEPFLSSNKISIETVILEKRQAVSSMELGCQENNDQCLSESECTSDDSVSDNTVMSISFGSELTSPVVSNERNLFQGSSSNSKSLMEDQGETTLSSCKVNHIIDQRPGYDSDELQCLEIFAASEGKGLSERVHREYPDMSEDLPSDYVTRDEVENISVVDTVMLIVSNSSGTEQSNIVNRKESCKVANEPSLSTEPIITEGQECTETDNSLNVMAPSKTIGEGESPVEMHDACQRYDIENWDVHDKFQPAEICEKTLSPSNPETNDSGLLDMKEEVVPQPILQYGEAGRLDSSEENQITSSMRHQCDSSHTGPSICSNVVCVTATCTTRQPSKEIPRLSEANTAKSTQILGLNLETSAHLPSSNLPLEKEFNKSFGKKPDANLSGKMFEICTNDSVKEWITTQQAHMELDPIQASVGSETSSSECRELIDACQGEESLEIMFPCLETSTEESVGDPDERISPEPEESDMSPTGFETCSSASQSTLHQLMAFSPAHTQLLETHHRFFVEENQNPELVSSRLDKDKYVNALRNDKPSLSEAYLSKPPSYANADIAAQASFRLVGHLAPEYSTSYRRNRTQSLSDLPDFLLDDTIQTERKAWSDGEYPCQSMYEEPYMAGYLVTEDDGCSSDESFDESDPLPQDILPDSSMCAGSRPYNVTSSHSHHRQAGHMRRCSLYDEYQDMLEEVYGNASMVSLATTTTTEYTSALEELEGPELSDSLESLTQGDENKCQGFSQVQSLSSSISLDSLNEQQDFHVGLMGNGCVMGDSSSTYTDDSIDGGSAGRPRVVYGYQLEERLCKENLIQTRHMEMNRSLQAEPEIQCDASLCPTACAYAAINKNSVDDKNYEQSFPCESIHKVSTCHSEEFLNSDLARREDKPSNPTSLS